MDTFTPLWSKIVDSSLWREPMHVRVLFVTMLAKKDADHVVRASVFNLSEWAKMDQKLVLEGLKILAAPDTRSLEPQQFEGRRIEEVREDGQRVGWLLLKGEFYRKQMSAVVRRFKKTASERARREEAKLSKRQGETLAERLPAKLERQGDKNGARRSHELASGVPPGTYANEGPDA
jgi:hypothetical protein